MRPSRRPIVSSLNPGLHRGPEDTHRAKDLCTGREVFVPVRRIEYKVLRNKNK